MNMLRLAIQCCAVILIIGAAQPARAQTIFVGQSDQWSQTYTYTFFPLDPVSGQQVATTCLVTARRFYRDITFDNDPASPSITFEIWGNHELLSGDPLCPPSSDPTAYDFAVANVNVAAGGVTGSNSTGSLNLDWEYNADASMMSGTITSVGIVSDDSGQIVEMNNVSLAASAPIRATSLVATGTSQTNQSGNTVTTSDWTLEYADASEDGLVQIDEITSFSGMSLDVSGNVVANYVYDTIVGLPLLDNISTASGSFSDCCWWFTGPATADPEDGWFPSRWTYRKGEVVSWDIHGTVTSVDVSGGFIPELPSVDVGSQYLLRVEFDPLAPLPPATPGGLGNRYRHIGAVVSARLFVGGLELQRAGEGFSSIDIWDGFAFSATPPGADGFNLIQGVESSLQGGFAQFSFIMRGPEEQNLFSGPGLPRQPSPLLSALSTQLIQFVDQSDFIVGSVDNIEVTRDALTDVVALPDINANGFADVAVLMEVAGTRRVHVRDGITGALISDIGFGSDPFVGMAVITDISGNGIPEIAVVGTRPDGNVRAQIKDSLTAAFVNNVFYGTAYSAIDIAVIPDTNANSADELLVMGMSATGGVRAQARDVLSDAVTSTTYYGANAVPQNVLSLPDLSGNSEPEVVVSARVTASSQARAQMRDTSSKALLRNLFFGTAYAPVELAVVQDISGDGIADLAQLARREDTGAMRVQIKATDTGATVSNAFIGNADTPVSLVGIGDANGNMSQDVAILVTRSDGTAKVIVRDGASGSVIGNIFAGAVQNPKAIVLVDDLDFSGDPDLAILGEDSSGNLRVQIKDSVSGAQVNTIDFP